MTHLTLVPVTRLCRRAIAAVHIGKVHNCTTAPPTSPGTFRMLAGTAVADVVSFTPAQAVQSMGCVLPTKRYAVFDISVIQTMKERSGELQSLQSKRRLPVRLSPRFPIQLHASVTSRFSLENILVVWCTWQFLRTVSCIHPGGVFRAVQCSVPWSLHSIVEQYPYIE